MESLIRCRAILGYLTVYLMISPCQSMASTCFSLFESHANESSLSQWGRHIVRSPDDIPSSKKVDRDFTLYAEAKMPEGHLLETLNQTRSWDEYVGAAALMSQFRYLSRENEAAEAVQLSLRENLNGLLGYQSFKRNFTQGVESKVDLVRTMIDLLVMNALNGVQTVETFGYLNGLVENPNTRQQIFEDFQNTVYDRIKYRIDEARALEEANINPYDFFRLEIKVRIFTMDKLVSQQSSYSLNHVFGGNKIPFWMPKGLAEKSRRNKLKRAVVKQLQLRSTYKAIEGLAELETSTHEEARQIGIWAVYVLKTFDDIDPGGGSGGGGGTRQKNKDTPEFDFGDGELVPIPVRSR